MGSRAAHSYVRVLPLSVVRRSRPFAATTYGSDTVTRNRYVALSHGWSFTGYHPAAPAGSLATYTPRSEPIHPVSAPAAPLRTGSGAPPYRTAISNRSPRRTGWGREIVSSRPRRAYRAGAPSTAMSSTSSPSRSRFSDRSRWMARIRIRAVASMRSLSTSTARSSA